MPLGPWVGDGRLAGDLPKWGAQSDAPSEDIFKEKWPHGSRSVVIMKIWRSKMVIRMTKDEFMKNPMI